jgi:cell division protein FtsL
MGEKFEEWKNFQLPEAMVLSRKFREVAVAYEEAKADPTQDATQEEYIALQIRHNTVGDHADRGAAARLGGR